MTTAKIKLNFIAILVLDIAAFMHSILWYSPLMFGKIWELYRHPPNPSIPQWTMLFSFAENYCLVCFSTSDCSFGT